VTAPQASKLEHRSDLAAKQIGGDTRSVIGRDTPKVAACEVDQHSGSGTARLGKVFEELLDGCL